LRSPDKVKLRPRIHDAHRFHSWLLAAYAVVQKNPTLRLQKEKQFGATDEP
jgi:hypothetical protein